MNATRTAEQIIADIATARAQYHAIVDTGNRREVAEAAALIKPLQQELAEHLADGAQVCEECLTTPMGMVKTPEILDADGNLKSGAVYEVGCTTCARRARAGSPEVAVKRWNNGAFIKDAEGALK